MRVNARVGACRFTLLRNIRGTAVSVQLYTSAQCRELDRLAIEEHGIPGFELMLRAGRAAFEVLVDRWPEARTLGVYCGKGNNAGDGYVIAGLARELGIDVQLAQVDADATFHGAAALAKDWALERGVQPNTTVAAMQGDVLVDAMLGTGLEGVLREPYAASVAAINDRPEPVVAIDVPTGVSADTGAVLGDAVHADVTVSFIGEKVGLHTGPGLSFRGELIHDTLGVPDAVLDAVEGASTLRFDRADLPKRDVNLYKHGVGHLVVIGGDTSMGGAPLMAAEAALRTGAGLVSVVTRPEHRPAILARRPELMVLDGSDDAAVNDLIDRATGIVLGPGLGGDAWGRQLFESVVRANKPLLVDADGLRWLAELKPRLTGAVVTPHAAEAAALLAIDTVDVQNDRLAAAGRLATMVQGVAVLKGAGSVCASAMPHAPGIGICSHGNPGMATAGMGDVLSGVIGGLLVQGLEPQLAAKVGVCLHSYAADVAAEQVGERGLLATDLLPAIARLLR